MNILSPLLLTLSLAGATEPSPFDLRYEVARNGSTAGESHLRLSREGDDWVLSTRTEGTRGVASLVGFQAEERSRFQLQEGALRALEYRRSQRSVAGSRDSALRFDWQQGEIEDTDRRGEVRRYPLTEGALDRHLGMLQVIWKLAEGERDFVLELAGRGEVEPVRFQVTGEETVQTPAGRFDTVRVERLRSDSERRTISWHAPELGYLPVQLQHVEDRGEEVLMRLSARP